jgi:predicted nuclease of restriction endonuclease-like (RecB) superfamily
VVSDIHTFKVLVNAVRGVDDSMTNHVSKAINAGLTLRNWLIGCYISEYQLTGTDRAKYGESLLENLARELSKHHLSNCNKRQLYDYLKFYRTYPEIVPTVSAQFKHLLPKGFVDKVPPVSAQLSLSKDQLVAQLSYSKFKLLVDIDDPVKRTFYEIACIDGGWSVREFRRQISSLYFERSGLSNNKVKLSKLANKGSERESTEMVIRDPYVFEFLGLKPAEVMRESQLEDMIIDKLQSFLLELGHGFCFEARQKRILIGDEHFFVDLVFYHRILKCHVLVELKLEKFNHENIGQLNTYVNWYKKNVMEATDNPPVGILLCSDKNHALAEYALAGMDNKLFASKYLLELPKKHEMQKFIEDQITKIDSKSGE